MGDVLDIGADAIRSIDSESAVDASISRDASSSDAERASDGSDPDGSVVDSDGEAEDPPSGPPVIVASCNTTARQNTPYSCRPELDTTSIRPFSWELTADHSCAWLAQNPSTGELAGTPRNPDVGTCNLAFRAHDGWAWSEPGQWTLGVANLPPTLRIDDAAPLARTTEVVVIRDDAAVQANDEGSGTYSIVDPPPTTLPPCSQNGTITIDANSGAISFLQSQTFQGRCEVTVQFDDLHPPDNIVLAKFQVPVVGDDRPPVIQHACPRSASQDSPYACSATGTDPDGDSLTWAMARGNRCGWIGVDASGALSGTPRDNDVGSGSCLLRFEASDGLLTTVAELTLTIQNTPPTLALSPTTVEISSGDGPAVILADAHVQASEEGFGSYYVDRCALSGSENCSDWGDLNVDERNGAVTFDPDPNVSGTCLVAIVFDDRNAQENEARATTSVSVAPVPSPGAIVSEATTNLLSNPGCEDPTSIRGDIAGWDETVGTNWRCQPEVPPHECTAHFFAGAGAYGELLQWVDLSPLSISIDRGKQVIEWRAFVASWGTSDASRTVLDYIASDQESVLDTFDSGEVVAAPLGFRLWRRIEDVRTVPVGARWVRIRLMSTRYAGTDDDGYFDGMRLRGLLRVE